MCRVFEHLLGIPHVTVERWKAVKDAVDLHRAGVDFADALHWAGNKGCDAMVTLDKRFVRSARRLAAAPPVSLAG